MANFSVTGAKLPTKCSVKTYLDTGSGITVISAGVTLHLKKASPGAAITRTTDSPQSVRIADGRPLQVTEMTYPIRIAVQTSFWSVTIDLFVLAVMLVRIMCSSLDTQHWRYII